jgi:hypothetical protein
MHFCIFLQRAAKYSEGMGRRTNPMNTCPRHSILLLVLAAFAGSGTLHAQVPQLINYQGRVVVGTTNFNGTGFFRFALVNANGSTTYWSNDGTSSAGSQPMNAVSLTVSKGLYSVLLGDTSVANMTVSVPASVFNNSDVRLRVWFSDNTPNGSQLLSPDQRIASVGYAAMAANIVDGAITSAKIANGAVGTAQISNGSVGASQIASGAVGSAQIASNAVNAAQIAAGAVGTAQLANSAVTSAKIDTTTVQQRVTGTAPAGSFITGINQNGTVASAASGSSIWSLNGTNAYYSGGNVGVGTSSPVASFEVNGTNGNTLLYATASRPTFTLRDTAAANALSVVGGVGGALRFYTDAWEKGTNTNALMTIDSPSGFVGIGTMTPQAPLQVTNLGAPWTSNGWKAAAEFDNATAISWQPNSGGTRFGIGHTNGGLFIFRTASDPGNTSNPANYDFCIIDTGKIGMGTLSPTANLEVHGTSTDVEQTISNATGQAVLSLNSNVGGSNHVWSVESGLYQNTQNFGIYDRTAGRRGLEISAATGMVTVGTLTITGGSDVAEPFPMEDEVVEKGAVVVIDPEHPGRLRRSTQAYDQRVAGIVSGAKGIKPGIALHQEGSLEGGENVALSGRVYVQAESSNGFIEPGDFLTTSDVPGYAMKATDAVRRHGAILGKAMSSLRDSRGTVLVLVTLQ